MAYQRVPETAEIVVNFLMSGVQIINTFHARYAGGYAQANLDALALNIDFTAVSGLLADLSNQIAYVRTDVRGLDAEHDLTSTNNSSAGNGGIANQALPQGVAFCVQRLSGLTGRSARGRVFIGGIPQGYMLTGAGNNGLLTAAAAAAYLAHIDTFRVTINAVAGWQAVIVSRYHGGVKRDEGITFSWTASAIEDERLDYRTRRKF